MLSFYAFNYYFCIVDSVLVAKCLLLGKGTIFHCRCAAHILNLIVQEGLLAMSNAVTRIRESVKYVKSSQGHKQRFEKMIKEVGISCDKRPPLDAATWWNSTYQMLKCALEYEKAFESLTREDSQYVHQPLVMEWKMAKKLCDILKTF
ncbi:zinc finger BED domain-containing protein RICESLEEPER 2-like [Panicum miliaceum]|uniref:Zinc finger BED domain-containing protein RICESLEEPER 2-like n=1 Tax=Panicum miliaceum TaxID=4540 RepID=A0A3L6QE29_PANMI|nr:zinc finger BED domain-containing protein RICESLEEPER 2-like [Panicum miliaceum]